MQRLFPIAGGAALLGLWMAAATPLIRAEALAWGLMPALFNSDADARGRLVLGDAYTLAERAAGIIPVDSRVLFLSPVAEGAVGSLSGTLRYRLYPRTVTVAGPGDALDLGMMREAGYILVYLPGGAEAERYVDSEMARLAGVVPFSQAGAWYTDNGYAAVYRVEKGAAQ